mmetsp:Transcript_8665/g.9563  ORF Transcript_8665/g.9563 Transcript_8665/m.9563 type:complete len:803 (+) Transcript_8665:57-2465(+)
MSTSYALLGVLILLDALFLVNLFLVRSLRRFTDRKIEAEQSESENNEEIIDSPKSARSAGGCEAVCCGMCFDTVKKDVNEIHTFPAWKPVYFGYWSTAFIVIVTCVLLSPKVLPEQVGVDPTGGFAADLCTAENFEGRIEQLVERIESATSFSLALRQKDHAKAFQKALVADTSLYGTGPYECEDTKGKDSMIISGKKKDWKDSTVPPASTNGQFFPGYCAAALEAALLQAQETECTKKMCSCPTKLVLGKQVPLCFLGRACVDVSVACPPHTSDGAEFDEESLQNYRLMQLEKANKLQKQVLNSTFVGYVSEQISESASAAIEKLLFQVDIASTAYVLYTCVGLFFPAPLVLFRAPILETIRSYLFGIHKLTFIAVMIAVWWGVEYFHAVFDLPSVRLYLQNLRLGEPCFLDSDFLQKRQEIFSNVCGDLLPMEEDWETSSSTINQVLMEVGFFVDSCDCSFPNQKLSNFQSPGNITAENAGILGFNREIAAISGILAPSNSSHFLGDATVCTDPDLAREIIFDEPDDETNWWELWIATGILAQVFVKFAVTNFGIALFRFADPLSICGGRFQWPPSNQFQMVGNQEVDWKYLKFEKDRILKWISFKWALIWGVIVHICIFNLIFSATEYDFEDIRNGTSNVTFNATSIMKTIKTADSSVGIGTSITAIIVFFLGGLAVRNINKKIVTIVPAGDDTGGKLEEFTPSLKKNNRELLQRKNVNNQDAGDFSVAVGYCNALPWMRCNARNSMESDESDGNEQQKVSMVSFTSEEGIEAIPRTQTLEEDLVTEKMKPTTRWNDEE